MEFFVYLIILAVWGLFVGAFARLALPGRDPMSLLQTMAVGLGGSFIAGILMWVITDGRAGAGFLVSLVALGADRLPHPPLPRRRVDGSRSA